METDGDQNQQGASTNGSASSGTSSRPSPMTSMSLYERQAVQALQALQRQPNAAQYFQQLMLQQQINNAQLAAVQQVKATLAAGRQSSPPSSGSSQTTITTAVGVTSGSSASSRPLGATATSTISQSVLLSGSAGGQGQMYLRVNRSLRAPISSQLIFMPGSTATAAVATVAQQPPAQQEVTPASSSSSQSDNDQVQNLALRGVSSSKAVGVKVEAPDRSDGPAPFSLVQPPHQSHSPSPTKPHPQPPHIKIPTYPQPAHLKPHPPSSPSIPLSQLLLHGPPRTLSAAPPAAHTLVLTSSSAPQPHSYPVGTATLKPASGAQTLVVQPLQQADRGGPGAGPVPIQPKALQGLRLPLQLPARNPPPILPAPTPPGGPAQPPPTPHIPVQIVGARQSTLGSPQALALARGSQEGAAVLTVVASIASREGGVGARGAGLKAPQEVPPLAQVSQVHPQANQSAGQGQNGQLASSPASSQPPTAAATRPSVSVATEEQRGTAGVTANGEATGSQTPQGKQLIGSLKRKCDSKSANDEDGPSPPRLQPIKSHAPALPANPVEAGSVAPPPSSSSPPGLMASRRVSIQGERAPPPQAVVKPSVLTHLIEGFVIQEGAEPFPVCGSVKDPAGEDLTNDGPDNNQSDTVTTATGTTSASGRASARARLRVTPRVKVRIKVSSPTLTRRAESSGAASPAGPAQRSQAPESPGGHFLSSAGQSPVTRRKTPVGRTMKTTPCLSLRPPRFPATSRPPSRPRAPPPAACLRALANGAWRKCRGSFPLCRAARSWRVTSCRRRSTARRCCC
ncbi:polyhomeotic-like protein 1 isoform X1 [Antennarius striatus]|uniref:polyhomeotic-like protein 1 isoform X1 n=1 Tax=Antennarius striatus TaxID=241820 RepID=UPI0035ADBC45